MIKKYINETPVLTAEMFHTYDRTFPNTVIITWRKDFIDSVETITNKKYKVPMYVGGVKVDIYLLNKNLAFACVPIGSPTTAYCIECLHELGAEKFVFMGSCGELKETGDVQFIVPTKAYRGEGTSQYYTNSRKKWVSVYNFDKVEEFLKKNKYTYTEGFTYTTDALLRETPTFIESVKRKGCNCIDMECSMIMALSECINVKPYYIFFKADSFTKDYDFGGLSDDDTSIDYDKLLDVAIKMAKSVKD